jgi:hypothetical protein
VHHSTAVADEVDELIEWFLATSAEQKIKSNIVQRESPLRSGYLHLERRLAHAAGQGYPIELGILMGKWLLTGFSSETKPVWVVTVCLRLRGRVSARRVTLARLRQRGL